MALAVLSGEHLATHRMSPQELETAEQLGEDMKTRHLWEKYGIDWWAQNLYPAPVIDRMLRLDRIDAAVLKDKSSGNR